MYLDTFCEGTAWHDNSENDASATNAGLILIFSACVYHMEPILYGSGKDQLQASGWQMKSPHQDDATTNVR
jgi:hypothetical protein